MAPTPYPKTGWRSELSRDLSSLPELTKLYLRDHVDVNMQRQTAEREREIVKTFNRYWGATLLHEISGHRIEEFKRDRLAGRWRAHRRVSRAKPIKPSTVNRELDTLRLIFNKARCSS